MTFQERIIETLVERLKAEESVLAAWQGGSHAFGAHDEYSDLDLCVVANQPIANVLDIAEQELAKISTVTRKYRPDKLPWGDGMVQTFFFLESAPKFYFVDLCVFDSASKPLISSFLEVERHGTAKIFFDKKDVALPQHTDQKIFQEKKLARLREIEASHALYVTLVKKEIARGSAVDAIAFYQGGIVRPLVEVLGMIYRPYQYDYGLRYLKRSFPEGEQNLIEELVYVSNLNDLEMKLQRAEAAFGSAIKQAQS